MFPRVVDGRQIVTADTETLVFELEIPIAEPILSVIFVVRELKVRRGADALREWHGPPAAHSGSDSFLRQPAGLQKGGDSPQSRRTGKPPANLQL